MSQDFTEALKQEYLAALKDEDRQKFVSLMADERYRKAVEYRSLTGRLLKSKGVDPETLPNEGKREQAKPDGQPQLLPSNGTGLPEKPVTSTHLVYLVIRKHGNVGYLPAELEKLAEEEGYGLTANEASKVYWKQATLKRMEKKDGKIFITKEGEKVTKFRVQRAGDEYKPMIQHFPAEPIK
jgi:hypothetical protein